MRQVGKFPEELRFGRARREITEDIIHVMRVSRMHGLPLRRPGLMVVPSRSFMAGARNKRMPRKAQA